MKKFIKTLAAVALIIILLIALGNFLVGGGLVNVLEQINGSIQSINSSSTGADLTPVTEAINRLDEDVKDVKTSIDNIAVASNCDCGTCDHCESCDCDCHNKDENHVHTWKWYATSSYHIKQCQCGKKDSSTKGNHSFGSDGKCSLCGYYDASNVVIKHTHAYSNWKCNSTQHWKQCSCGDATNIENHTFANNGKCTICGFYDSSKVIKHTHAYGNWKCNSTQHWKQCSCGDAINIENHTFANNGKCTICGFYDSSKVQEYCIICGDHNHTTEECPYCPYCYCNMVTVGHADNCPVKNGEVTDSTSSNSSSNSSRSQDEWSWDIP